LLTYEKNLEMMPRGLFSRWQSVLEQLATRNIRMGFEGIPLLIENVPFRKICNWFATGLATYVKPENPWGWPLQLQIEPTNRCNLH
jgi:hypothetical protein